MTDDILQSLKRANQYHDHAQLAMRTLVLYHLWRTESDYDEYDEFTVLAHDEQEARQMCADFTKDRYAHEWLRAPIEFDKYEYLGDTLDHAGYEQHYDFMSRMREENAGAICEVVWLQPGIVASNFRNG